MHPGLVKINTLMSMRSEKSILRWDGSSLTLVIKLIRLTLFALIALSHH